ncbi:protein of unknown function [Lactiplantibacillus plantarum]
MVSYVIYPEYSVILCVFDSLLTYVLLEEQVLVRLVTIAHICW